MFRIFSSQAQPSHDSNDSVISESPQTSPSLKRSSPIQIFKKFKHHWEKIISDSKNESLWSTDIIYTEIPYSLDVMVDCLTSEQACLNDSAMSKIGLCAEFLFEENVIYNLVTLSKNDMPRGYQVVVLDFLSKLIKECDSNLLLNASVHVPISDMIHFSLSFDSVDCILQEILINVECRLCSKIVEDPLLFSIFTTDDLTEPGSHIQFPILDHLMIQLGKNGDQFSSILDSCTAVLCSPALHSSLPNADIWNTDWIGPICHALEVCLQKVLSFENAQCDQKQLSDMKNICALAAQFCNSSRKHDPFVTTQSLLNTVETQIHPVIGENSSGDHILILTCVEILLKQEWPRQTFESLLSWLLSRTRKNHHDRGRLTPLSPFVSMRDWFLTRLYSKQEETSSIAFRILLHCLDHDAHKTVNLLLLVEDISFPRLPSPPPTNDAIAEKNPTSSHVNIIKRFRDFIQLLDKNLFEVESLKTYLDEDMLSISKVSDTCSSASSCPLSSSISSKHPFMEEMLEILSYFFDHSPCYNIILTGVLSALITTLIHSPDIDTFLGSESASESPSSSQLSLYAVFSSLRDHILAWRLHTTSESFDSGYKSVRKACFERGILNLPQTATTVGATKLIQLYQNMVVLEEFVKEISSIILIRSIA